MNPKIVAISIKGPAKILDIQKVNDTVLNAYAIIGIITILAENVKLKEFITPFIILFFRLVLFSLKLIFPFVIFTKKL